jgi:hypothetical protein
LFPSQQYIKFGKLILKPKNDNTNKHQGQVEEVNLMKIRTYPTLLLALMGSMDCITTVIGILYFGAVELNPFIAGVVSTNLPAFVILKLTTTVFVCLIFIQAEKILMKTQNTKAFSGTQAILEVGYVGVIVFLAVVVTNNAIMLANAI